MQINANLRHIPRQISTSRTSGVAQDSALFEPPFSTHCILLVANHNYDCQLFPNGTSLYTGFVHGRGERKEYR